MKIYFLIIVYLFCLVNTQISNAQCCAFGTPTAGTTNVGTVPEEEFRITAFFRNSTSEDYYFGRNKMEDYGSVKTADYNYLGLSIAYGLIDKLTLETEFGYFLQKKQTVYITRTPENTKDVTNSGLNNMVLSAKYNILDDEDLDLEWTLGAGVKIPLETEEQSKDGVIYNIDMQTSTRAWGGVFQSYLKKAFSDIDLNLYLTNRIEFNGKDKEDYRFGNSYSTALFASKKIIPNLIGILQFRHEIKEKDTEPEIRTNTGSTIMFISPQLSYKYNEFNIAVLYDYPFYKNYYAPQLAVKQAFSINLSYQFGI